MLLHTDVDIDAAPAKVWAVLTDLRSYQDWNPFIFRASGVLRVGGTLTIEYHFKDGQRTSTPTLLAVEPERQLRWLGKFSVPGIFSAEHSFTLTEPEPGKTRLVQDEKFKGLAVPLVAKDLREDTLVRFEAMNQALKQRAEAVS